jgi:hypothetical protein
VIVNHKYHNMLWFLVSVGWQKQYFSEARSPHIMGWEKGYKTEKQRAVEPAGTWAGCCRCGGFWVVPGLPKDKIALDCAKRWGWGKLPALYQSNQNNR